MQPTAECTPKQITNENFRAFYFQTQFSIRKPQHKKLETVFLCPNKAEKNQIELTFLTED